MYQVYPPYPGAPEPPRDFPWSWHGPNTTSHCRRRNSHFSRRPTAAWSHWCHFWPGDPGAVVARRPAASSCSPRSLWVTFLGDILKSSPESGNQEKLHCFRRARVYSDSCGVVQHCLRGAIFVLRGLTPNIFAARKYNKFNCFIEL